MQGHVNCCGVAAQVTTAKPVCQRRPVEHGVNPLAVGPHQHLGVESKVQPILGVVKEHVVASCWVNFEPDRLTTPHFPGALAKNDWGVAKHRRDQRAELAEHLERPPRVSAVVNVDLQ